MTEIRTTDDGARFQRPGIYDDALIQRASRFTYDTILHHDLAVKTLEYAHGKILEIQADVEKWYQDEFGYPFNRFKLGETFEETRRKFLDHKEFDSVLKLLGIDQSLKEKIRLPWWSEVSLVETNAVENNTEVNATFSPAHSFHIQLLRSKNLSQDEASSLPIFGHSVTVSGLLITTPSDDALQGKIALGVRGGSSFSNTIHMVAGAAKYSDSMLRENPPSLTDIFITTELKEESGFNAERSSVKTLARFVDAGLAPYPGDVNYCFLVETGLSKDELVRVWGENADADRDEHEKIVFINNDPESVREFLKSMFFGISENKMDRTRGQMELLYPASLALCAQVGISLHELGEIAENNQSRKTW